MMNHPPTIVANILLGASIACSAASSEAKPPDAPGPVIAPESRGLERDGDGPDSRAKAGVAVRRRLGGSDSDDEGSPNAAEIAAIDAQADRRSAAARPGGANE